MRSKSFNSKITKSQSLTSLNKCFPTAKSGAKEERKEGEKKVESNFPTAPSAFIATLIINKSHLFPRIDASFLLRPLLLHIWLGKVCQLSAGVRHGYFLSCLMWYIHCHALCADYPQRLVLLPTINWLGRPAVVLVLVLALAVSTTWVSAYTLTHTHIHAFLALLPHTHVLSMAIRLTLKKYWPRRFFSLWTGAVLLRTWRATYVKLSVLPAIESKQGLPFESGRCPRLDVAMISKRRDKVVPISWQCNPPISRLVKKLSGCYVDGQSLSSHRGPLFLAVYNEAAVRNIFFFLQLLSQVVWCSFQRLTTSGDFCQLMKILTMTHSATKARPDFWSAIRTPCQADLRTKCYKPLLLSLCIGIQP